MALLWRKDENGYSLCEGEEEILHVPAQGACTDSFVSLAPGAWKWTRKTEKPVSEMRMTLRQAQPLTWWLVPGVNYNGNGWGSGAQYTGFDCGGEPWTWAWHRTSIPACTFAEGEKWAAGLFGEETGGMSGSITREDGCAVQNLIWPVQEGPKTLSKRCWLPAWREEMAPQDTFTGIIFVTRAFRPRKSYQKLLAFAWDYFAREVKMPRQPEDVVKLDTVFFRTKWYRKPDGLVGYSSAFCWDETVCMYTRSQAFEIGWVGQNASLSCTLLREYLKTGEEDLRDKAISALDTWVKYARLDNGLFYVSLIAPPEHLDSVNNGNIPLQIDACNLGTGAVYLFKAAKLAEQAGVPRPEYRDMAMDLCDFACRARKENGEFAKSYFIDGSVDSPHGSVGAFMILPLFDAWELTGDEKYLTCAKRAYDFYQGEFDKNGFTTAGALDSFCIDKESAAPLLRAAVRLYDLTGEARYLAEAQDIAWYLNTWLFMHSISFPEGSVLRQIGYDSYGGTSVSAAHNALDPYAVYYVPEFLRLADLTGEKRWEQMARAMWYNGIERISDGTMVIDGRIRPTGFQDESCRQTHWGRTDKRFFVTSGNFVNWPGAFRQVALDMIENWDRLR